MASGIADSRIDPESISDAVSDIKQQLDFLLSDSSKVNSDAQGQGRRTEMLQSKAGLLEIKIQLLAEELAGLCQKAEAVQTERIQSDEEYTNLLQEKIQVLEEDRFVRMELQTQAMEQRLSAESDEVQDQEVENEKQLLDFAKEDLANKMADLDSLQQRLEEKRMDFDKEWEGFKDDIRRVREERRPYIKNLQEFDNLVMSRFKGILRFAPQALGENERAAAERTIQHLEIKKELEEEKEKLLDCEIMARDLRLTADSKFFERNALWKQFDKLQEERRALQPGDEVGTVLRETRRMENLLADPGDLLATLTLDSGDNELLLGGKSLHRCHKNTDVSFPLSEAERNELSALLYDGEEESEKEGDESNVDVDKHDMQTNIKLDQDLSSQTKPSADLDGTGPSDKKDEPKDDSKDDSPDDDKTPHSHDATKNLLKTAEGSAQQPPSGLMSKLRSRMGGGLNVRVDPVTGEPVKATGGLSIQRHSSDSRYKVDTKFLQKRGRRQ